MRRNVFVLDQKDNAEVARGDILSALYALRMLGHKTICGLERIANHAGLLPRRTRTIVMKDQPHTVTEDQRRHLALAIADLFDRIADEHEAKAEACRLQGDGIRYRERQQLALTLGGKRCVARSISQLRRQAA